MKKILLLPTMILAAAFCFFIVIPVFQGKLLVPASIEIGPMVLRWYGLTMALAILVGYSVCKKYSWRFGIEKKEVDAFSFWLVIASFLGARIYFVVFAWDYFARHLNETYKVWHGGLSIYGALIAGLVFVFVWTRNKAYGSRQLLDLLALALPLAQATGRWGNFFNQEAFGLPTSLPWKMFVSENYRPQIFAQNQFFHPTFLYEALAMICVFFILKSLVGRLRPGVLGFAYLVLYSLVRFFVEPLRLDSVWINDFRADQVVALVVIMLSGIVILRWQFEEHGAG